MFLEIKNAYYYPYIPRRRGRSMSRPVREQVNISDFSTIKLLFDKLNIDQQTYNDYLSGYAQRTKLQQYYNATIMGQHIDYQGPQGVQIGGASFVENENSIEYKEIIDLIYLIRDQLISNKDISYDELMLIFKQITITMYKTFNNNHKKIETIQYYKKIKKQNSTRAKKLLEKININEIYKIEKYNHLYLIIIYIIKNALFELKKYVEMNKFRINKFKFDRGVCGYCNKKLNQYIVESDFVNRMINELLATIIITKNSKAEQTQPGAGPMDGAAAEEEEESNKIEELKTYIQKDIDTINVYYDELLLLQQNSFRIATGGRKSKKNNKKNKKRKTRKSKNKLRKTRKRKNRQDKNKKP